MMSQTLTLLLFLLPYFLAAQPGLKVEKITPKDGLSYRWIMDMTQDSRGFMWIATYDGLNRYDGSEFTIFRHQEGDSTSLRNNIIRGIEEDQKGRIWVMTEKGCDIYDPATQQFRPFQPEQDTLQFSFQPNKTLSNHLLPFFPGIVPWFQGAKTQLDGHASPSEMALVSRLRENYKLEVVAITKTGSEAYWFWMTNGDYIQYEIGSSKWTLYDLKQQLGNNRTHPHLPIDAQGRFWYPALQHSGDHTFDFFQLPAGISLANWSNYLVDNLQNIWLQSVDGQFFHYDVRHKTIKQLGTYDHADIAFEDREGTKWLGHEMALVKMTESKQLFETYLAKPFNLGEAPPVGISCREMVELENGDVLLRHQASNNLYRLNATTQTGSALDYRSSGITANNILYKNDGQIWMTIEQGGLYRQSLADDSYDVFPADGTSYVLAEDGKGRLWTANQQKDGKQFKFLVFHTSNREYEVLKEYAGTVSYAYYQEETGILWAAYQKSLLKINTLTDHFAEIELKVFQGSDVFGEGNVWCIWPWRGQLWLGSAEGLLQFDPETQQVVRQFTIQDGLPNNRVYTVLSSGENLWLGTHNGLCRFNPETLSATNFYVEDGLTHNEFNRKSALKTTDGKLWFGGLNGVIAFYPRDLEKLENRSAELVWTKYSKYSLDADTLIEQPIHDLTAPLAFTNRPDEQEFIFHFALLRFVEPAKNQYHWYLEGYEKPWSQISTKPVARYPNIKPGTYTFRVKAVDHTGTMAQNELAATITILEVWYKRWWAWGLYISLGLLGFYTFYRFRLDRQLEQRESARLKELDEVKNRLYTNITHEFRTPLTVILGMSAQIKSLIADIPEKNHLSKATDLILRSGQNLLNLVNRMLDLAKLESGTMSLNLVNGDIIHYLNYLIESFHSFAAIKNIQIHFLPNLEELQMDYDSEKLQHIVSNLLSNAIKFTPEGGHVYVTVDHQASTLLLKVKDTGIGIAATKLPHIFDRFYQADASTTREGEGTGIGLALVRELVKLMEGEITVKSKLGKGTIFKVSLPVKGELTIDHPPSAVVSPPLRVPSDQLPDTQEPMTDNGRPILLIIEDNFDVAYYIESCLEDRYQIVRAHNGQEGIDKAIEFIPDGIISDVMMPKKNGFEVVQILKNDERTSHIPIILLTAKADVTSKIAGLERGADAYLAKPFNEKELSVRLVKLIELRKQLQERYAGHVFYSNASLLDRSGDKGLQIEDEFLLKIRDVIEQHVSNANFDMTQLCRTIGMSRSQIYRKVKALTGSSPVVFIRTYRLQKGKALLASTDLTTSEIAYEVGFSSLQYFSDAFFEEFGIRPSATRK